MVATSRIAVIAGDGIGKEVVPVGIAALEAAAEGTAASLRSPRCRGAAITTGHGRMMDDGGFEQLKGFDAIYLSALSAPGRADGASAG
jgi:tartrate dehydrogenase/decarboxylase/D-malate dehydrogenase